jgi:hypothetical protein
MRRVFVFVALLWALALACVSPSHAATIYVRTVSAVYTAEQVATDVAAIQESFALDFNPAWGTNTQIVASQLPPSKVQLLTIVSESNVPDALGYHDVAQGALPYGVVMAKTAIADHFSVSVTISHELQEMAVDPLVNDAVKVGKYYYPFYLQEASDPVESDRYAYKRRGVLISDFVTPNWFRQGSPAPWDFTRNTVRPLQILPGGYQIAWSRIAQKFVHLCASGESCRRSRR